MARTTQKNYKKTCCAYSFFCTYAANLPSNTLCARNEQCQSNICQYRHELSAYACTTNFQIQMRLINKLSSIFSLFKNNSSSTSSRSFTQLFRRVDRGILGDARNDVVLRPVLLDFMASDDGEVTEEPDKNGNVGARVRRRLTLKNLNLNSTLPPSPLDGTNAEIAKDKKRAEMPSPAITTDLSTSSHLSDGISTPKLFGGEGNSSLPFGSG